MAPHPGSSGPPARSTSWRPRTWAGNHSGMDLTLVRNATLRLEMGGRRLLVDPMLDPAGARPPISNTPEPRRNPLVELPVDAASIVEQADAVAVTHLHADHLDDTAVGLIADRRPVFAQPGDAGTLRE